VQLARKLSGERRDLVGCRASAIIGAYLQDGFFVIDGRHRIAHALKEGKESLLAYVLSLSSFGSATLRMD
jgi:hypothetical protein